MRYIIPLLILLLSARLTAETVSMDAADLSRLRALAVGEHTSLSLRMSNTDLDSSEPERVVESRFRRIDVYAPGAQILEQRAEGFRVLPRDRRVHVIATDGKRDRIGLSIDDRGGVEGIWIDQGWSFRVQGSVREGQLVLQARDAMRDADGNPLTTQCGGSPEVSEGLAGLTALAAQSSAQAADPKVATRQLTVAVDTDNEVMLAKFSNNSTTATNYIAALFVALNVIYTDEFGQFGLKLRLNIGTTVLRPSTTADPYSVTGSPAGQAHLNEFGAWWQANQAAVPRAFALLLSGKSSSPNSASGIAWRLGSGTYCTATASNGGHYSVNQIFTGGFPASSDAYLVGHELGHNFGARHTHCANATTGGAASTNTIDRCFSGESGSGCYAGTQACPTLVESPTAPMGSLMSYCHLNGLGCGVSNEIHPTHVTQLDARISSQPGTCVSPIGGGPDMIFASGFE